MCVTMVCYHMGTHLCDFPGGSDGKESACNAGDLDSIPGLGRSPEGGSGSLLQYSCLENPMDRGAWQAIVHGVTKRQKGAAFTFTSPHLCTNIQVIGVI